jgi:hypothetical protein
MNIRTGTVRALIVLGVASSLAVFTDKAEATTNYTLTLQEYIRGPISYTGGQWAIQFSTGSGSISCTPGPPSIEADALYTRTCTATAGTIVTVTASPLNMGHSTPYGGGPNTCTKGATFLQFIGTGAGSYTGTATSKTLTVNNNMTEYGSWAC